MARFKKLLPSAETLHHWFFVNYETGELFWKNPRGPRTKAGDKVYYQPSAYPRIRLQNNYKEHSFLVHRVIWKMYYGKDLGQQELDHIDGNKWNNAISNLRIATPSQNSHNRKHAKGIKRNSWYKDKPCSAGGWETHITIDGKRTYMGMSKCPVLARMKYLDLKSEIAGPFNPF